MSQDFPLNHFVKLNHQDEAQGQLFSYDSPSLDSTNSSQKPQFDRNEETFKVFLNHLHENSLIDEKSLQEFYLVQWSSKEMIIGVKNPSIMMDFQADLEQVLSQELTRLTNLHSKIIFQSQRSESQESESLPLVNASKRPRSARDASFTVDFTPNNEDLKNVVESRYIEHVEQDHGLQIDDKKTFISFIVGPSNNLAYASCMALSKKPGKSYPTVYLYSKSGLGKTHLLHATANDIKQRFPQMRICLTTAQNFLQEMVESIREQKIDQFRKRYTDMIDVLLIDDIHELKNKQGTQNAFFHIFNDLYNKGKQLIFTSDKTPKEIDGIEERIKTRLSWGLVIDIQQPDLETRIAILKRKAQDEDIYLSDDVLHLIASCIKDNIRELEGSLIKLAAYSSIFKQDIDVEIARRELKLDEYTSPQEVTLEKVARAVSQFYKVPIADLKSKSRLKEVAEARHAAMYLSYRLAETNYKDIGQFYGNRDHSTVIIGVRKIKAALKENTSLAQDLLEIENGL